MPEPDVVEEPTTEVARARLRRALVKPDRGQLVVAALLVALGFAAVTQVRATDLDNTYAGYREQDLIDVLTSLSVAAQRADTELARLQRTRDDLRSDTNRREAALAEANQTLDTYSILAGLVPVSGPGIRMTVEEESGPVAMETMIDTIQELRNAGAEAISVNGEVRVVAQSSVGEGVGGLTVDGVEVSAPYVVEAIGEPTTLRTGMSFRTGPVDQFEEDGATVTIEELSSLTIDAVRNPVRPSFAEPDSG